MTDKIHRDLIQIKISYFFLLKFGLFLRFLFLYPRALLTYSLFLHLMVNKSRRCGYKFQIRKSYADLLSGKIYHRPLIETKYWEDPSFTNQSSFPILEIKKGIPKILSNEAVPQSLKELLKTRRAEPTSTQPDSEVNTPPSSPEVVITDVRPFDTPRIY